MVKNIIRKGLPVLMAAAMTVSATPLIVLADEVESPYEITEAGTATTTVETTIGSTFKVVIPKKVTLAKQDSGKYAQNYTVEVKDADIAPGNKVDITVAKSVNVARKDAADVVAFSQTATAPDGQTVGTVTDGETILASATDDVIFTYALGEQALTAGNWSGTATFNVALN